MFDIVLVLFGIIVIAGAILVFGGNDDDDDHTHRPHTGALGDIWQNKNQIFVSVIFLAKNILNLVQRFKI